MYGGIPNSAAFAIANPAKPIPLPKLDGKPTADGYYWTRIGCRAFEVVQVYYASYLESWRVLPTGEDGAPLDDFCSETREWYGPLTPPENVK